jgi:hypothetical protein
MLHIVNIRVLLSLWQPHITFLDLESNFHFLPCFTPCCLEAAWVFVTGISFSLYVCTMVFLCLLTGYP